MRVDTRKWPAAELERAQHRRAGGYDMRVLLTGAAGFIGSTIADLLLKVTTWSRSTSCCRRLTVGSGRSGPRRIWSSGTSVRPSWPGACSAPPSCWPRWQRPVCSLWSGLFDGRLRRGSVLVRRAWGRPSGAAASRGAGGRFVRPTLPGVRVISLVGHRLRGRRAGPAEHLRREQNWPRSISPPPGPVRPRVR